MLAFVYIVYTQIKATACISFFCPRHIVCNMIVFCHFVWISPDIGVLFYKTNAKQKAAPLCSGPVSYCM